MIRSSVLFGRFLLADFLEILCVGNLESLLVVLVETVLLEGVEGDGRLQHVLEVHKTQQVLTSAHCGLLYQTDALEPWERTKNV